MCNGARGLLLHLRADSPPTALQSPKDIGWEQRIRFCIDTAQGMAYLHSNGLIHRDLKPGNLLVSPRWVIKIADFGTSRLLDLSSRARAAPAQTRAPKHTPSASASSYELTTNIGTEIYSASDRQN